jgi:hypothetical protein
LIKLKHVPVLLASCLLIGGLGTQVSAQDRNWDRNRERAEDRGWQGRDRGNDDRDRASRMRDRDEDHDRRGRGWDRHDDDDDDDDDDRRWRGRDRDDDDHDRRWRGRERWWGGYDRGRNCYTIRRRFVEPDGDVIIRRSRVCEY